MENYREKSYVAMSEEFTFIGWKLNEHLYYWRGKYWRWTRSPMHKDDPPHVFEELTDEHKEGWHLNYGWDALPRLGHEFEPYPDCYQCGKSWWEHRPR